MGEINMHDNFFNEKDLHKTKIRSVDIIGERDQNIFIRLKFLHINSFW